MTPNNVRKDATYWCVAKEPLSKFELHSISNPHFLLAFSGTTFYNNYIESGRKTVKHRGTSSNRKEGKSRMIPNWIKRPHCKPAKYKRLFGRTNLPH